MLKPVIPSIILSFFVISPALAGNFSIPFTPQAPHANWSQPWQDACEEATVVMVDFFYNGFDKRKISSNDASAAILNVYNVKTGNFGWSLDENADKIAELINNFYGWEAHVVSNPTLEQIKQEIDEGRPVILPAYGRALRNPHFQGGGPQYHTVVISGYDETRREFIVQEPGTRHGLDFRYSYGTLMDAMHDYLPFYRTKFGKKVAIFTSNKISRSSETDGDGDGLTKLEEIRYGTVLYLSDSDGDGYTDGQEVKSGFSPTLAEKRLRSGTLVKSPDEPAVYLIESDTKRPILNEDAFLKNGFRWIDIFIVSSKFLSTLRDGLEIG